MRWPGPSARERALKKLAEKRERQERERQRKEEADRLAREARKAKAEGRRRASGLRSHRCYSQAEGPQNHRPSRRRASTRPGDGLLNAEEMRGALAKAGLKLNRIEARALIEYLDEDDSGEIDAKELENALRQWRRDFSEEHAHPKPHEMSKNHALMAAKAARARLHEKPLREPADGFDPIALCFSRHWLPTRHVPREAHVAAGRPRAAGRRATRSASSASGARRRSRRAHGGGGGGGVFFILRFAAH